MSTAVDSVSPFYLLWETAYMSLHCVALSGCAASICIVHIKLTYNSLHYVIYEDFDVNFNYPHKILPFHIEITSLRPLHIYRKCQGLWKLKGAWLTIFVNIRRKREDSIIKYVLLQGNWCKAQHPKGKIMTLQYILLFRNYEWFKVLEPWKCETYST